MFKSSLTLLAKIEVRTDWAFVTSSCNIFLVAVVASDSLVDNSILSLFLDQRLFHLSAERIRGFFLLKVIFGNKRLAVNSGALWKLLRNFRLNLGNDLREHLLEPLFNHALIDLRDERLINHFYWFLWFLELHFLNLLSDFAYLLLNLNLFSEFHELFIDFLDVDLRRFGVGSQ